MQTTLAAPVFADPGKTRAARAVHSIIVALALIALLAIPAVYSTGLPATANQRFALFFSAALIILLLLEMLLRRGRVRLAALGVLAQLAVGIFLVINGVMQGITLISMIMLLVLVPLAGVLFGMRGVWGALGFVLLTLTVVLVNGSMRPFSALPRPYNVLTWAVLVAVLVLYGLAESLNARALGEQLADASKLADELARKNSELELARASLEARVAERTAELTKANVALQASEARFRSLFESAPESIVVLRFPDRVLVDANRMAGQLFGYPLPELIGKSAVDVSSPNQPDGVSPAIRRGVLEGALRGKTMIRDWTILTADGREVDVEMRAIELPSDTHDLVRITVTDISERKRFEAQLHQREAAAHEFQERLKRLHSANSALSRAAALDELYRRAVELGREELGFDRLALFLVDRARGQVSGAFGTDGDGSLRDDRAYRADLTPQLRRLMEEPDGETTVWQDAPLSDFHQTAGQGWSLLAVLRHEGLPTGYLIADNLLTGAPLRSFEPELLALYGVTLAHHVERVTLAETLQQRAQDLQAVNTELEAYRAGLETLVLERTAQLAEAKESAEAANQAKSSFLTTMSHELRTPLNAVVGFLQLLQVDNSLNAQQARYLAIMERSVRHVVSLVNDALNWAKLETGQETLDEHAFNPCDIMTEVAEAIRPSADQKGLALRVECPALPNVVADDRKLRQVLTNLVTNGVRYTRQGQVVLRAELAPSGDDTATLICTVADTGIGIDLESVGLVFEPFVRLASDETVEEGSGLGLPIVKHLLRLMGGEISIVSTPGQGTECTASIPVRLTRQTDLPAVSSLPPLAVFDAPDLFGWRVLIVEDVAVNRLLLVDMLEPLGLVIAEARDGREALERLDLALPDVLLLDVRLPDMSGLDIIARLRAMPGGSRVRVVVLSAHAFQADEAVALTAGADAFLRKPFNRHELLTTVANQLSRPNST